MMDQSRRWPASVDRHVQSVENQLCLEVVRHGPAYNLSGVGVEHEGEVEPPLPSPDVSDVRHPQAVRSLGSEVALHQVRSRGSTLGVRAEGRASLPPWASASEESGFAHQTSYAFSGAPHAERFQLEVDPRSAV